MLAGPLPHLVYANMDRARFTAVNTAKGPWALLQVLRSVSQASGGPLTQQPAWEPTSLQAAQPSAPAQAVMPLDAVAKVVWEAAASILGPEAAEGQPPLLPLFEHHCNPEMQRGFCRLVYN